MLKQLAIATQRTKFRIIDITWIRNSDVPHILFQTIIESNY